MLLFNFKNLEVSYEQKNYEKSSILYGILLLIVFVTAILAINYSLPNLNLLAAYPSFPSWAISAIQWVSSATTAVAIIGGLVSGGLVSIAATYIKKYGVKVGIRF
ncbi:MAG: hypothetical protein LBC17_02330 [Lactobacillaceae bacterium]|jgi:hypothetical protein|nr:hypothetical protein [Lactobacillaceae bacterium]